MAEHRSLIAFRFALTRKHNLQEGKDFIIKPRIGGGKVVMNVTFINHNPDEYKDSLEAVALNEKCEVVLKKAA